jgi:bifunctional non-homologous end joining protein LigD
MLTNPFHRDGYVYEEKNDGWRMVAYKHERRVRLVSRRGIDHTQRFADIAAALAELGARTLVLDGEVCVFDQALVSHMHLLMDPPDDAVVTPPVFMAFDCLYVRGPDVRAEPLKDRRKRLEDEIDGSSILAARRLPEDGLQAWALVQARGYEGLVAKNAPAPYGSSIRWWKLKVRWEGRFVIGGIAVTPSGYRGLLLGQLAGRELRYVGTVEWGVGRALVEALIDSVPTRTESPFTDHRRHWSAIWLEPRVVAEVTFSEFVNGWLRDPVLRQLVGGRQVSGSGLTSRSRSSAASTPAAVTGTSVL